MLEKWPADYARIRQEIQSGAYQNGRWGDINEIGFRKMEEDQKDDIKSGQEAVRELQQQNAMPPDLDNKAIQDYANMVAQRPARNSDLLVPLKVVVLRFQRGQRVCSATHATRQDRRRHAVDWVT